MKKNRQNLGKAPAVPEVPAAVTTARAEAFTFGDPVPMLDQRELLDFLSSAFNGKYYDPPVSFDGLAKSLRSNPHHSSAIYFKRNVLAASFKPNKYMSRDTFSALALDYLVFGNSYIEEIDNRFGSAIRFDRSPAKYTRKGKERKFFFLQDYLDEYEFSNKVFHIMEHDINQEIYGLPEYLSGLNSAWLSESATLFRRKYYLNGSHAGFILYMTDTAQEQSDVDSMREALRNAKGPGNFRNLFMYAPNGKKDGIQILPISEVAAKDDFLNIKNSTRDDVLAVHRVPPVLMGIMPNNTGGFGDVEKADKVFNRNEIATLQAKFLEFNELTGLEVITFLPYQPDPTPEKNA